MSYMFDLPQTGGRSWKSYFDYIFVDAQKPRFFQEGTTLREVDEATGSLKLGQIRSGAGLERGKVYAGGRSECRMSNEWVESHTVCSSQAPQTCCAGSSPSVARWVGQLLSVVSALECHHFHPSPAEHPLCWGPHFWRHHQIKEAAGNEVTAPCPSIRVWLPAVSVAPPAGPSW